MESGILEIIWDPGLGFGIRNIAQGIRNATNDWNPAIHGVESKIQDCLDLYFLTWGDKTMLSPQMPGRWNWNSLMTLFILGSVISNEDGFRGDVNKVSLGKAWRVFSISQRVD